MTIPADKIPDDIMQEARELFDGYSMDAVILAARAIMEERERCADIADELAVEARTEAIASAVERDYHAANHWNARAQGREEIASAIRNEGEQR